MSNDGFVRIGVSLACLKTDGIIALLSDAFIILVMTGKSVNRCCFRIFVGIGSRLRDLSVAFLIFLTSFSLTVEKVVILNGQLTGMVVVTIGVCQSFFPNRCVFLCEEISKAIY